MTLNASYSSQPRTKRRSRLQGRDRGLDVMVGLVILIVEFLIGPLVLTDLYAVGLDSVSSAADPGSIQTGFLIAAAGSALFVGVTTITFLSRIIRGFRSWTAPVGGLVLMSAALVVGSITMADGL